MTPETRGDQSTSMIEGAPFDVDLSSFNYQMARLAVEAYDGAQEIRKAQNNRVRDVVRKVDQDIPFDRVEGKKLDADDYESKYDDDKLPGLIEDLHDQGELSEEEMSYLQTMLRASEIATDIENEAEQVMKLSKNEPIYTKWLDMVYGVSHTYTARLLYNLGYCGPVIITEVREDDGDKYEEIVYHEEKSDGNIHDTREAVKTATEENRKARRDNVDEPYVIRGFPAPSHLISYAGYVPGQTRQKGQRSYYDPQLKSLVWQIANNMIRQGDKSLYRKNLYDPKRAQYERRMENSECQHCGEPTTEHTYNQKKESYVCADGTPVDQDDFEIIGEDNPKADPPWSQTHANSMARRYMGKWFLKHYWTLAREFAGLETLDYYIIAHGGHSKQKETWKNPYYALRQLKDRAGRH